MDCGGGGGVDDGGTDGESGIASVVCHFDALLEGLFNTVHFGGHDGISSLRLMLGFPLSWAMALRLNLRHCIVRSFSGGGKCTCLSIK